MKKTTIAEISEGFKSDKYFKDVMEFLQQGDETPAKKMQRILDTPYEEMDPDFDPEDPEAKEPEKDCFEAWHTYRAFELENAKQIIPRNVETFTLVTDEGHVCIIRKPIGRVLGKVVSKMSAVNKDPDLYEAGSIIIRECRLYMEKPIETDPDQLFSVKMAAVGSVNMKFTRIKKN